jgi:hypothetical protein
MCLHYGQTLFKAASKFRILKQRPPETAAPVNFFIFMQKSQITGLPMQFARYKYSLYEYLYLFTPEARQTAGFRGKRPFFGRFSRRALARNRFYRTAGPRRPNSETGLLKLLNSVYRFWALIANFQTNKPKKLIIFGLYSNIMIFFTPHKTTAQPNRTGGEVP